MLDVTESDLKRLVDARNKKGNLEYTVILADHVSFYTLKGIMDVWAFPCGTVIFDYGTMSGSARWQFINCDGIKYPA